MKQIRYSWALKIPALIINQISAITLALSISLCVVYVGSGGVSFLQPSESFVDSEHYRTEARDQAHRCIRALSRESRFETDGAPDLNLLVNMQTYLATGMIDKSQDPEEGINYRLKDLLDWYGKELQPAKLYHIWYEDGLEELSLTNGSDYQYPVAVIESADIVNDLHPPIGYGSLLDYANKSHMTMDEVLILYDNLVSLVQSVSEDYRAYTENLEVFNPSMTNMRYMLIPLSAHDIDNTNFDTFATTNFLKIKDGVRGIDGFAEYIRSFDSYLIYNTKTTEFECEGIPMDLSDLSSYLKGYPPTVEGDYVLMIAIDPDYRASDSLRYYKDQYERIQPASRFSVAGLILGTLLYFISLVYLTLAAGHHEDDDPAHRQVHLNKFDEIRTELGALIVILPAIFLCVFGATFLKRIYEVSLRGSLVIGGGLLFMLNILFLCGYLSLIRRGKANTLWSNSVTHVVAEFVMQISMHQSMLSRTAFAYIGFALANILLIYFGQLAGVCIVILLDIFVAVKLMGRALQKQKILDGIHRMTEGDLDYQIPLDELKGDERVFGEAVNHIAEGFAEAVNKSVRDEKLRSDLITNVSHDIKTPLTSIINYVNLLKHEDIQNERAQNYIHILEEKSQRLKTLTEDLVEASKISSGNVTVELMTLNLQEFLAQTNGEFADKFEERGLTMVTKMAETPIYINADGRHLWRVIENVYGNVAKYAMPKTRVYVDLVEEGEWAILNVKNISQQALNIKAEELTERFIRGDVARSTEGSGLGLNIAKSLTTLMGGSFEVYLDGDLFRVSIAFPSCIDKELTL